ncbi:MAG: hypothetical protein C4538_00480 [Nitrospiraceae bacterium]|nr:MAG: hypothetical protein C4538_00480 [Nitrospiraceae bacterium]
MQKKLVNMLLGVMMLALIPFSYSNASTASVTLDGIANAGWSEDNLTSTYLYVRYKNTTNYYYQWRYGDPEALRWSSLDALVSDPDMNTFDWWLESGGDPFNAPSNPIWTSIYLEKGLYDIRLAPDSSAYNLLAYWGGNQWNNYVQIWADYDGNFNFGEGAYIASTANDSLNFYRSNVDGMTISLKENANLYFYINDTNSVDNSGSVKLDVTVVPEPGQVLLFISGALPLVFWSQRKKMLSMLKQAVHKT